MGNVSGDGETEYWLSVLGLRESSAQSEEDVAASRTYGEAEVRALLVDMRAELAAADADYASGKHGQRRGIAPPSRIVVIVAS